MLAPLLLVMALGSFSCKNSNEQTGSTRALPNEQAAQQQWQPALRAFAPDSADLRLLQTWATKRAQPADTLALWLRQNYWPLQSLGIRLVEQAFLLTGFQREAEAQAKLDTVRALGQALATACNDTLLINLTAYISTRTADTKPTRAVLTLQRLSARALLDNHKFEEAALAHQNLRDEARKLGDAILEIHAEQGALDALAQQDLYQQAVTQGEALAALARQHGYHWAEAQTLNILADAHRALDRDALALQCAERAFNIAQRMSDRLTLRDSYFYRARTLYRMDRLPEAEAALHEMTRLDHEEECRADALLLTGQMHQEQGEYGLAQTDMEQAVSLFERNLQIANVAAVRSSLSLLHVETGDYERALSEERKAFALHQSEASAGRMARSQMNLGFILVKIDSLDSAQASYAEALRLFRMSGEGRGRIETLLLQGELLMKRKLFAEAEQTFGVAAREAEALGFAFGHAGACLNLAKLALQQNRLMSMDSLLTVAEAIAGQMNNLALQAEAQWQRARLAERQARFEPALAHLEQALVLQEKVFGSITRDSLRVSFFATIQDLFDEAITLALQLGQNERALSLAERGRTRALLEAWGREIADSSRALLGAVPSIKAVQSILPRSTRIIEYRVLPEALAVWLISAQEFVTLQLPITRAALEDSAQKYLFSLGAVNFPAFRTRALANPAAVYEENRAWGRKFYDRLLAPAAQQLAAGNEIYLIPDGFLYQLPFGAFVTPQERFVEEEYELVKAPSLAVLYRGMRTRLQVPQLAGNRLLFAGNPAGDLPAAQEEMTNVAALFTRKKLLSRNAAHFDTVKTSLREGAEVFHLSLHAVADPQRALNSYLELSRAEATALRPSTERIYARRLLEWEMLNTWLVLLNGCETAGGKIVRGEGVLNIARLFALQRVSVVVASLWKNDDRWSAALVTAFYRQLAAGVPPPAALRLAKLEILKKLSNDAQVRHPLPYFWAVFELYLNRAVTQK